MGRRSDHFHQMGLLVARVEFKRPSQNRVARQRALYKNRLPAIAPDTLSPMAQIVNRHLNDIRTTLLVFHVGLESPSLYEILRVAH